MKSSASKIKMTSVDDLFGLCDLVQPPISGETTIQELPLKNLVPFHTHPFKVLDDDKMEEAKESIAKYGVLVPIIVRPTDNGNYEIIAGHRRKRACELLELETIPSIIKEVDDEESTIIMVDSNIQRENLLFSEKAFAYNMKLEAVERKMGRPNNVCQVGTHYGKRTTSLIGEQSGESARQVDRYIRLTELIPPLLDLTDSKALAFNTAVELSYLPRSEQEILLDVMQAEDTIPSMAQAKELRQISADDNFDRSVILAVLQDKPQKSHGITFKRATLQQYFPKDYSTQQIEEIMITLLKKWNDENIAK